MKLSEDQADVLDEFLISDGWMMIVGIINERVTNRERELKRGKLEHDEYVRTCASIREAEYLRDEPARMVRQAKMGAS